MYGVDRGRKLRRAGELVRGAGAIDPVMGLLSNMRMRRRRYILTRGRDHASHNDLIKTSAMQARGVTMSWLTGADRGLQAESAGPQCHGGERASPSCSRREGA
jgi:hypothetical protein